MTPVMRTPVSPPVHGGINGSSCCTGSGKKPLSPSGQFGEAGSPKADAQAFSGLQSADAAAMPGIAAQAATKAAPSATQMSLQWGKNTVPSRGGGPPFAYQMGSYRNPCGIDGTAPPGQGAAESNPCAAAETRGCDAKPERKSAICAPQVPAHGASAQPLKTDAKGQPVWAMGSQADASWKAPTPGNNGGRVDMAPPGSESSPTKLESPKKAPVGIARPVVGSCAGAGRGPGIAVRVLPQATASGASPLRPLAPKFPPVGPAGTTPRASATTQEVRARVLAPPGLGVAQLRMSSEPDGVPTSRASRNLAEAPLGATEEDDPARRGRGAAAGGTPAASGGHADSRGSVSSPGSSYGTGVPPIGRPDKGKPDKGTGGGGGGKLTPPQQMAMNSLAIDKLNSMPALDDAAKAQRDKLVDEGKKLASTLSEREKLRAQKDKERFRRDQEREERQSRRRDEKRAARQDRNRSRRDYRATQAAKAKRSANKAKKFARKAQKLAKAAQNKNLSKPARDRLLEKADAALTQALEATQEHASQSAEADPAGGGIEESVAAEVISAVQEVEKARAGTNGTESKEEEERERSAAIAPETRIAGPPCSDPCPCNIECPPGTFCVCSRSEPPPGGVPLGQSIMGLALPLVPLLLAQGDDGGGQGAGGQKDDGEKPEGTTETPKDEPKSEAKDKKKEAEQKKVIGPFKGYEDPRYQQHDELIRKITDEFNKDKVAFAKCTEEQAKKIPDLTPELVKAWLIQETGGTDPRSLAAWPVDPAQVNVPGDWNDFKEEYGLRKPERRNEGTAASNLRAAVGYLAAKGFGKSGQPPRNRPRGTFDGWSKAIERYNGRTDVAMNGKKYSENYAAAIANRAGNPGEHTPIALPKPKKD